MTLPPVVSMTALHALIAHMPEAICLVDRDGCVVALNSRFTNYAADALHGVLTRGSRFADVLASSRDPQQIAFWSDLLTRTLAGREVLVDGWQNVGGTKRYLYVSSFPIVEAGLTSGCAFVVRDMTYSRKLSDRERIEVTLASIFTASGTTNEALSRVLEFLAAADGWQFGVAWLLEGDTLVPAAMWHDGSVDTKAFEEAVSKLRFRSGHGIPGRVFEDRELLWLPDLVDETAAPRTTFAAQVGFRAVAAVPVIGPKGPSGAIELFTTSARPLSNESARSLQETGAALGGLLERRASEEERARLVGLLQKKGSEWASTFDAIESPILLLRADGTIVRVNQALREQVQRGYGDIVGKRVESLAVDEVWRTVRDLGIAVMDAGESTIVQAFDAVSSRYWELSGSPLRGDVDAQVIVVMRDMTAVVNLQDSLRRGEQLAAMGELVAGVAHEVRNPLFGMSVTLDAYEPLLKGNAEAEEMFAALRTWIARLSVLMENLLEYGKTWNLDLREGLSRDVVSAAVDACRPLAERATVALEVTIGEPPIPILMDPNRLTTAVQNLIINAIQHSSPGSRVEVSIVTRPEEGVELTVRDHGPGFNEADLPRVFQPFFTRRRGGTGLGLSIVQRVMDEHGGTLDACNAPDGGALVRARLPRIKTH